jgi:hypothetical protein
MVSDHDTSERTSVPGRRSFVAAASAFLAVLTIAPRRLAGGLNTKGGGRGRSVQRPESLPQGYPSPHWIPDGYVLSRVGAGLDMGFGSPTEIMLHYGRPHSDSLYPYPLHVVLATNPIRPFWSTDDASPDERVLQIGGSSVRADYYNGMWWLDPSGPKTAPDGKKVSWNTACGHALVLRLGPLTVGIRGFRPNGVFESDLLQIAESIS